MKNSFLAVAAIIASAFVVAGCSSPSAGRSTAATSAAPVNVAGQWHWVCCDGKYSGGFTLEQDGDKLTGRLYDNGDTTGGALAGNVSGSTVKFTRTWGDNFQQDYTLVLAADGKLSGDLDGTRDADAGTHFEGTRN
jgi:hypothetical protein